MSHTAHLCDEVMVHDIHSEASCLVPLVSWLGCSTYWFTRPASLRPGTKQRVLQMAGGRVALMGMPPSVSTAA